MSVDRLVAALAGRYQIERELGAGGMATVYLAADLRHDRKVAIKVLRPELAAVLGAERFVREIKTTAGLSHPHILPLFDSGEADGFLYYVMPYLAGETIRDRLDREIQLGIEDAVRITVEVADALDYAHRHGVIHRDIKPENILLCDGRAMVMDFGIALAVSAAAGERMTETGLSLGTPHYMSPEQVTADRGLTARSDVYSLACVLYEMLAGEPPHSGASAQAVIMKAVAEPARPVELLRRSVPPNVAAALGKALEKVPADRFDGARAFAEALRDPGFATSLPAVAVAPSGRRARIDRRTIVAVVGATAGAVALGWAALQPGAGRGPVEYDVGLPDTAAVAAVYGGAVGFAVARSGDFLVYETAPGGRAEIWFRSLLDATVRRIPGTEDGAQPALSPDDTRLAFLRTGPDGWSVEILPLEGGEGTVLGRGASSASLQWLPDGRLLVVDSDGTRARWFDPEGGPTTSAPIAYCLGEDPVPDAGAFLCGGGARKLAYLTQLGDSTSRRALWRAAPDSAPVFGSHFRLVDGRYLVYLSITGDLLAAPVDLGSGRVGRAVRMATGLARAAYAGTGAFAISASGTLVYAQGANQARGHLVVVGGGDLDTLPVGQEAFLTFDISPDGRRLAAVVEGLEGAELRLYDLDSGRFLMWMRRPAIRHPTWSPRGDRVLFGVGDSVLVGSPDRSAPPELVLIESGDFEGQNWVTESRVVGALWRPDLAVALNIDRRPATIDTLLADVVFARLSPDGRWLAYTNIAFTDVWVEPFPGDGRRFLAASGSVGEAHWLSSSTLAISTFDGYRAWVDRVDLRPGATPPLGNRRRWAELPEYRETPGPSLAVVPGGRIAYLRGATPEPARYLHVVPDWVHRMRRAVDEANR